MTRRSSAAGGCFLPVAIIAGFLYGLSIADPLRGAMIGTAIGLAIALAVWLLDRRRSDEG